MPVARLLIALIALIVPWFEIVCERTVWRDSSFWSA
jgi:hypothetical protein